MEKNEGTHMLIPVYKPYLPVNSLSYAHEALDSTWISSQGKYIPMVTEKLQELLHIKYVLPVNNGTSACHLVAKSLNKKIGKKKHKVLCPDNVYVAAWNAFLFDKGQFTLITVKTDIDTWNIDLGDLDKKIQIHPDASVLIVHNMGNIVNVPELQKKYSNTVFVEDACEAIMGKYGGICAGTASFVNAFSTFANKTICSGEGGFVTTNDRDIYDFIKCVHGQGQSTKRFVHSELGYNYRMTNIQAAILYGQLEVLQQILDMKQDVFDRYKKVLQNRQDILMQSVLPDTKHSNWMFGVRVPGNPNYETAELFFNANGVEIRPMFYPITKHAHLVNHPDVSKINYASSILLNKECFILPSYPELKIEEQNYIIKVLVDYAKSF